MVEGLDMTLEELIQKNKKSRMTDGNSGDRGTVPGRNRYLGLENRAPSATRSSMHRFQCDPPQYLMLPPRPLSGLQMKEMAVGRKLYVSNLHYEVTENDIKVLFSDVGPLKEYIVHYDASGRSEGTAEVVFERESDAVRALRRYNNLRLDGRQLKIEFVGVDINTTPNPPAPKGFRSGTNGCYRGAYGRYTPPATEDIIGNGSGAYGKQPPLQMGGLLGNLTATNGSGAPLLTDGIKWIQTRDYGRPGPLLANWNQRKIYEREEGSSLVRGREGRQKRLRSKMVSAEALDADLDKYLQEAKKIR